MQTTTHTPADVPDTADTAKTDPDGITMRLSDVAPPSSVPAFEAIHPYRECEPSMYCATCWVRSLGRIAVVGDGGRCPTKGCPNRHLDPRPDLYAKPAKLRGTARDRERLNKAAWHRGQAAYEESRA